MLRRAGAGLPRPPALQHPPHTACPPGPPRRQRVLSCIRLAMVSSCAAHPGCRTQAPPPGPRPGAAAGCRPGWRGAARRGCGRRGGGGWERRRGRPPWTVAAAQHPGCSRTLTSPRSCGLTHLFRQQHRRRRRQQQQQRAAGWQAAPEEEGEEDEVEQGHQRQAHDVHPPKPAECGHLRGRWTQKGGHSVGRQRARAAPGQRVGRQAGMQASRQAGRQTGRQDGSSGRQAGRQDGSSGRQAGRQAAAPTCAKKKAWVSQHCGCSTRV